MARPTFPKQSLHTRGYYLPTLLSRPPEEMGRQKKATDGKKNTNAKNLLGAVLSVTFCYFFDAFSRKFFLKHRIPQVERACRTFFSSKQK